jgi:cyclin-dependent kinase 10
MDQEKDGFPITSIREVAILSALKQLGNLGGHQWRPSLCENIVLLKEVVTGYKPESIFLVFEYCSIDLAELIDQMVNKGKFFTLAEIKCLML